jgi:hypothetical protein
MQQIADGGRRSELGGTDLATVNYGDRSNAHRCTPVLLARLERKQKT